MLISLFTNHRRFLTFEELRTIQVLSQQIILSLDTAIDISSYDKKELAFENLKEILEEIGIKAPNSVLQTAIEASWRILEICETSETSPIRLCLGR